MQPGQKTTVTSAAYNLNNSAPNQKCPALIPASPPGAYAGRAKWAEVDVIFGSDAFSVTTPSCGDDAQAESSHEVIKARIPQHAVHLFTKPNLLIADADAISVI
jgi:hypothetical protein